MKTSSKSNRYPNSAVPAVTLGCDRRDSRHAIRAIDAGGAVLEERSFSNHRESRLLRLSAKYPGARMVIEVGSHSPWTSRFPEGVGSEVLAADLRKPAVRMHAFWNNEGDHRSLRGAA